MEYGGLGGRKSRAGGATPYEGEDVDRDPAVKNGREQTYSSHRYLTFDVSKDQHSDMSGMGSCLLHMDDASWDFGALPRLTSVLQFSGGS